MRLPSSDVRWISAASLSCLRSPAAVVRGCRLLVSAADTRDRARSAAIVAESPQPAPTRPPSDRGSGDHPLKPADDPGPAPAGCGDDHEGPGRLTSRARRRRATTSAYVPKSYAGKPTMLVVGLHGCGDNALNFANLGRQPVQGPRDAGLHIGISIGGKDGSCWDTQQRRRQGASPRSRTSRRASTCTSRRSSSPGTRRAGSSRTSSA